MAAANTWTHSTEPMSGPGPSSLRAPYAQVTGRRTGATAIPQALPWCGLLLVRSWSSWSQARNSQLYPRTPWINRQVGRTLISDVAPGRMWKWVGWETSGLQKPVTQKNPQWGDAGRGVCGEPDPLENVTTFLSHMCLGNRTCQSY